MKAKTLISILDRSGQVPGSGFFRAPSSHCIFTLSAIILQ
jgi:hypothetical protein